MKKGFILFCILFITGNVSYSSAIGGYDAGSLNSQYMRDLRTHELATRSKTQSAIVKSSNKSDQPAAIPESAKIKSIRFVNNKSIPSEDLIRVVSYKLNQNATDELIADLRKQIIRYYQANGFYSAIAFPNKNNLASGELIFEIQEGTKNSIVIE